MKRLHELWDSYWFRPAPLLNLAVVRVLTVGFQVTYLLTRGIPGELAQRAALPDAHYAPVLALRLFTWPFVLDRPPLVFFQLLFWLTVIAGICALVGFRTRLSLIIFAFGNVVIQAYIYSFGDFHHPEGIMMIALFLLALGPSGRVLSVDSARRRPGVDAVSMLSAQSRFARWPLLVVQWMFALIYLSSAVSKVLESGFDWANGYTLQYYLHAHGSQNGNQLAIWMGQQHNLAVLLSWATLLFEGAFFLVILIPALAWVFLPVGIGLHMGIYLAGMASFLQFIVLYAVFIPWTRAVRVVRLMGRVAPLRESPDPANPAGGQFE